MPKILHVIPSLRLGGEEKFLLDIYPFLSKKFDHLICPFLHVGELYSDTENLEKSKNHPFWIYVFKSSTFPAKMLKPLLWFYYRYRAWQFIKNEKPELIITYTPTAAFCLWMLTAFFIRHKKFKWYSHLGSHLGRGYFSPNSWMNTIWTWITNLGKKIIVKRSDCMIVVSNILKNDLIATCKANANKFFLLPICLADKSNYIEPTLKNQLSFLAKKQAFFIAAGRLEHVKGFDFLIKVFSVFSKKNPEIKLVIVGEGSQRCALEKLIKSLNMEGAIFLPGFIENPARFTVNAIATIVPSRSEGFGKIIIEAMQNASIVIASDCEGPLEIITNNVDGLLFKNENIIALLNAMNNVIQLSDKDVIKIKNNAYLTSLQYTPERISTLLNAKLEMDYAL